MLYQDKDLVTDKVENFTISTKKKPSEKEIEDFKKKIAQNEKEIKENIDFQGKKKEAIQLQDKKVKKVDQKLKELH